MSYLDALDVLPSAEVAELLQGVHASDRRRMTEQALAAHVGMNASSKQLQQIFDEWQKPLPVPSAEQAVQDVDPDAFFTEGMRLIGV